MFTHTMHPFGNKFSVNNTSINESKKSPNLGHYPHMVINEGPNHNSRMSTYAYCRHSHKKSDHAEKKSAVHYQVNTSAQMASNLPNHNLNAQTNALKKNKNNKLSTTPSKSGKINLNRSTLTAFYQLDLKKKKIMEKCKADKNRGK